mmetsp:Transcript_23783/g.66032  ORF Transcript_23783/g.66032 Transcript_23783/m.66032 type:complete len:164 (+) Transcript_23783:42-533(+)
MNSLTQRILICLALCCSSPLASAFLQARPGVSVIVSTQQPPRNPQHDNRFWSGASTIRNNEMLPQNLSNQRKSVAAIQTCGLFGLGFGEIAVVLVVIGFVMGPQNIGRILSASSTRVTDLSEGFKQIPEEFQKGMEEGESEVRARTAKKIKVIREEDYNKKDD